MDVSVRSVGIIRLGEFVKRSANAQKVYTRGEYDKASKRYSLVDTDDVSREVWVKKSTILYVGFTY